jgi:hypothetical protein
MDDAVRTHVRNVLQRQLADAEAFDARVVELRVQGRRIVSGGQTEGDSWEILDWETGQVIAEGNDGVDGYETTAERLDPDEKWIHIDYVQRYENLDHLEAEGIPASLAAAIEDWADDPGTDDEDLADVTGWPVDRVREYRD